MSNSKPKKKHKKSVQQHNTTQNNTNNCDTSSQSSSVPSQIEGETEATDISYDTDVDSNIEDATTTTSVASSFFTRAFGGLDLKNVTNTESCDMHFEFFLFCFLIIHLAIQIYNIHKTNFFNYGFHVLMLSFLSICKRVLLKYSQYLRQCEQQKSDAAHLASVLSTLSSTLQQRLSNSSTASKGSIQKPLSQQFITKTLNEVLEKHASASVIGSGSDGHHERVAHRNVKLMATGFTFVIVYVLSVYVAIRLALTYGVKQLLFLFYPFFIYTALFYGSLFVSQFFTSTTATATTLSASQVDSETEVEAEVEPQIGLEQVTRKGGTASTNKRDSSPIQQQQQRFHEDDPMGLESLSRLRSSWEESSHSIQEQQMQSSTNVFMQLKYLLLSTFECGYYAGVLPLGFVNEHVYYDPVRCVLLLFYVFANTLVMLFSQLLYTSFIDFLLHVQTLGCWKRISPSIPVTKGMKANIKSDCPSPLTTDDVKTSGSASDDSEIDGDEINHDSCKRHTALPANTDVTDPINKTSIHNRLVSSSSWLRGISESQFASAFLHNFEHKHKTRDPAATFQQIIKQSETGDIDVSTAVVWSPNKAPYSKGSLVLYDGQLYIGLGEQNSGVPGHFIDIFLFLLFERPDRMHSALIWLQALLTFSLLLLVWQSQSYWLVYSVMLSLNYYILYLCISVRRENGPLFAQMRYSFNK